MGDLPFYVTYVKPCKVMVSIIQCPKGKCNIMPYTEYKNQFQGMECQQNSLQSDIIFTFVRVMAVKNGDWNSNTKQNNRANSLELHCQETVLWFV